MYNSRSLLIFTMYNIINGDIERFELKQQDSEKGRVTRGNILHQATFKGQGACVKEKNS